MVEVVVKREAAKDIDFIDYNLEESEPTENVSKNPKSTLKLPEFTTKFAFLSEFSVTGDATKS